MKKLSARAAGFLEAAGLTIYVGLFAFFATRFQEWLKIQNAVPKPVPAIMLFLMAFIISALVSSAIVLAYPALLFFAGKKEEARKTLLWCLLWLVAFFAVFLFWDIIFLK